MDLADDHERPFVVDLELEKRLKRGSGVVQHAPLKIDHTEEVICLDALKLDGFLAVDERLVKLPLVGVNLSDRKEFFLGLTLHPFLGINIPEGGMGFDVVRIELQYFLESNHGLFEHPVAVKSIGNDLIFLDGFL